MGYNPNEIQRLVNEKLIVGDASQKTVSEIAQEVIDGKWGNNPQRKDALLQSGYDYESVQDEVNRLAKSSSATPKPPKPSLKSLDAVAREVIDGKWGNNPERREKLEKAGYNPNSIQDRVNVLLGAGEKRKSNSQIAQEVIDGKWGNNPERERRLKNAGYNPNVIQNQVNALVGTKKKKKSVGAIAQEVIDGKWGNNPERRQKLERAGYNYNEIQREVNRRL